MSWHIYIIIALVGILGAFAVQRYVAFRNAASKFRSSILSTLLGIYPPTTHWGENVSVSIIATLPAVKSAWVEFLPYVPRFRRKAFVSAYTAYEEQCRQSDPFGMRVVHAFDPITYPENPQTVFCKHVETLLHFANEN